MKKLLTLCLLAVTMCAAAQNKKVAVYVTGEDNPMNQILGDRLVDGIAQSGKYKAVERTASFLQELSKEQDYQRSGNVDEADISRLGKQFGVDYVCVATILDVWNEKYLTSRLIDVETAEVVASSSSSGQITSNQQFIAAMNTLSNGLLNTLAKAQEGRKKVAVYVTRTGNKDVDIILGDKLVAGFAKSGRFCAIERTNGFLKQLGKEQGYQQSGAVDDEELTRLGKQFGVDYVCIAKTADLFGGYYITSRLIDVETGEVVNSDKAEGVTLNTSVEVVAVASNIAKKLSGLTITEQAEAKQAKRERIEAEKKAHPDYTENAFGINMKMVWVEGGDFMMGCTSEQSDCEADEKNVRRVTVDGYWIGMCEVTQAQWEKVMGTSIYQQGNKTYPGIVFTACGVGPDYPMYCVSWEEAMEFCRLLSNKTGKTYTLPTEAQWEYAARGGKYNDDTKYAGSNMMDEVGWYWDNSGNNSHSVAKKHSNILGIYDMSGNVSEWCKDWYSDSYIYYDTNNPTGPSSGSRGRVERGGSYRHDASYCRVSSRGDSYNSSGCDKVGFRVVLIP